MFFTIYLPNEQHFQITGDLIHKFVKMPGILKSCFGNTIFKKNGSIDNIRKNIILQKSPRKLAQLPQTKSKTKDRKSVV